MNKKVLLVGAFANGNVGDLHQAESIADAVLAVEPTAEVSSVSPSKRAQPYPARNHTALPAEALWDFDRLNEFDLILVGGGGLLAAPHAPLHDTEWVAGLETRICSLSLGCAREPAEQARAFVERCERFSVRDEYSAEQISGVRSDVEIVMDPILLADLPDHAAGVGDAVGMACIAGKLLPTTRPFYAELERDLMTHDRDVVISMNEATDRKSGFDDVFVRDVAYANTADELRDLVTSRRFCVSERYHGCILALRWQVPCFGVVLRSTTVTSKITELYRKLDLPLLFISNIEDADRARLEASAAEAFDFGVIRSRLHEEQGLLRDYVRACLG